MFLKNVCGGFGLGKFWLVLFDVGKVLLGFETNRMAYVCLVGGLFGFHGWAVKNEDKCS